MGLDSRQHTSDAPGDSARRDFDAVKLVGRDEEREALAAFVADDRPTLSACMIDGAPGAGKTSLLEHAVRAAATISPTVLRASPVNAESSLPYVGLADLLADIEIARAGLPEAQARALAVILQHASDDGAPSDPHAVGRAVVSLLKRIALERPVVVAIDDAQWLDAPSSRATLFAFRRLERSQIKLIVTRRSGEAEEWRETLWRVLPEAQRTQLRAGPMSVDEVSQLLRTRLGLRLPRPALVALHSRCEGNPLHALELGRAISNGVVDVNSSVASDDLTSLLRLRLRSLTEQAQEVVLAAALASRPNADVLMQIGGGNEALLEACDAQVLEQVDGRVRFTHPLLASVAEVTAGSGARRDLHSRLADLVDDSDESALHRALGAESASAPVAASLEQSARNAGARGAPEIAAALAEHAARLSPDTDAAARRRRTSLTAEFLLAAGDPGRARELLEGLVREMDAGPDRADALWRLADAVGDDLGLSIELSQQALAEAGDDPDLLTTIHLGLAVFTWLTGELQLSAEHCRAAVALAQRSGNTQLLAAALADLVHAEAVLGEPIQAATIDEMLDLERRIDIFPPGGRPSFQLGIVYSYTDRLDEARPLFESELMRVEAGGDENARVAVLFRLGELELRAGNWSRALRMAREAVELAAQAGIEQEQCVVLTLLAAVTAHLGRFDEATAPADQALRIAMDNGDLMSVLRLRGVLGFVALSQNDLETADHWLAPGLAEIERMQIGEVSIYNVVQNQLDVLLALERRAEAERVIELLERKAGPQRRAWHLAVAARGRAVLAALNGDEREAAIRIGESLDCHRQLPQPFELARTLLAKGTIERRFRKRAAARETLAQALESFDAIGASAWAERAAAELARISGRTSAGTNLTATESRIAGLVAEGLSNGEVAARLFVSVRTVEAHLSHIYEKLGLRSRVDVARWMADQRAEPPAAT